MEPRKMKSCFGNVLHPVAAEQGLNAAGRTQGLDERRNKDSVLSNNGLDIVGLAGFATPSLTRSSSTLHGVAATIEEPRMKRIIPAVVMVAIVASSHLTLAPAAKAADVDGGWIGGAPLGREFAGPPAYPAPPPPAHFAPAPAYPPAPVYPSAPVYAPARGYAPAPGYGPGPAMHRLASMHRIWPMGMSRNAV